MALGEADKDFDGQMASLAAKSREQQIANIEAVKQAYHSYIDGTVNAAISGFDGMISGQKNWQQVGISIYQSVVREAEQQFAKMAEDWIIKHVIMAAASKLLGSTQADVAPTAAAATVASTKVQVAAMAGLAGAGGVASMAAAPWPMDMSAPEFGASMAATALSLGSFEVGTNMVTHDMIAQVHAGERIMPAADNRAIISALRGGGGESSAQGGRAGSGGGGGDTHNHVHNWNVSGMDSQSLKRTLMDHKSDIADALREHMRLGGK